METLWMRRWQPCIDRREEHLQQKEKEEQSSQGGPEPAHLGISRREGE